MGPRILVVWNRSKWRLQTVVDAESKTLGHPFGVRGVGEAPIVPPMAFERASTITVVEEGAFFELSAMNPSRSV